jgi:NADP-dependent 3-hydroxy acid dehydrogenase YdfG
MSEHDEAGSVGERMGESGKAFSVFSDKVALVTGASRGIGKAISLGLMAQDATVCMVGRELTTLKSIARDAPESRMMPYQADLTRDGDVKRLAATIQEKYGRVDVLIHCAAVFLPGKLESASVEDFDRQYRLNVRAPYLLTQALLPRLKSCQGQIVFLNSSVVFHPTANFSQYAATKHALKAIADRLREEVNVDGVRVLSVFPGRTATSLQAAVFQYEERSYVPHLLLQPEDVAEVVINTLALPRTAEVTNIGMRPLHKLYQGAIAFLYSLVEEITTLSYFIAAT